MSIHHEVTIHCDGCGHWEQNDWFSSSSVATRARRAEGWVIWRLWGDSGPWRHLCAQCAVDPVQRAKLADETDGNGVPVPSSSRDYPPASPATEGEASAYNAWQADVRDLTTKLRVAEQRADWARRQAMDDHPAGRVVRGPWGGVS